ncbi:hypothetical protein [Sphingomonas colocasiae]|uniref:Uncharacterized protein n=1 Tax=Sphingomonas colocasiae TaxID=1848973 RepID=A0ABS7PW00_9SPHN|nr:hypothetical protein [Sphingomonas colocasiae]MBY8825534.1 hypothetical protein [Sphingomonas colocasiae]
MLLGTSCSPQGSASDAADSNARNAQPAARTLNAAAISRLLTEAQHKLPPAGAGIQAPGAGCLPKNTPPFAVEGVVRGMPIDAATSILACAGFDVGEPFYSEHTFANNPFYSVTARRGQTSVELYYAGQPDQERVIRIEQEVRYPQGQIVKVDELKAQLKVRFGVTDYATKFGTVYGVNGKEPAPEAFDEHPGIPTKCELNILKYSNEAYCGATVNYSIRSSETGQALSYSLAIDDQRDTLAIVEALRKSPPAPRAR